MFTDRMTQHSLTRRQFAAGSVGAAITALLAACGGSDVVATTAPVATAISATVTKAAATTAPAAASVAAATIAPTAAATAAPAGTTAPAAASAVVATKAPAAASAPAGTTVSAAGSAPAGTSVTAARPAGSIAYAIVGDQSKAQYTAKEKLAMLPLPSDAVGTTNAVTGTIVLTADGKPADGSKITVDLKTLKSDQSRRDNYVQMNTLKSAATAEFVPTTFDGFKMGQSGSQTFKMVGNMTINAVTKPITFDTVGTMTADTLNGTATTTFKFADFNLTGPNIANFVTVEDTVKLDMTIVAKKA